MHFTTGCVFLLRDIYNNNNNNNNNVSFQTNVHIQYKNIKNTYINNNSTKKKIISQLIQY